MLLNFAADPRDSSTCRLTYEEAEGWMCSTWSGYVDPVEAIKGAEAYLRHAAAKPCALLLNDNSRLRGPWFDSFDWLAEVWLPQATRLGLRFIAHVVQLDRPSDMLSERLLGNLPFELQIFHQVSEAQEWLRQQRDQPPAPTTGSGS